MIQICNLVAGVLDVCLCSYHRSECRRQIEQNTTFFKKNTTFETEAFLQLFIGLLIIIRVVYALHKDFPVVNLQRLRVLNKFKNMRPIDRVFFHCLKIFSLVYLDLIDVSIQIFL